MAVTLGDPRGIGPEVMGQAVAHHVQKHPGGRVLVLGDEEGLVRELPPEAERVSVGSFQGTEASAGALCLEAIRQGVAFASAAPGRALVTGPVHKPALHAAGARVPGQTELLQGLTGASAVGMLMHARTTRLGSHPLRILLATTHVALRDVPDRLTGALLKAQVGLLGEALRREWGIATPRIGLCGLNPHASDSGLFGDEEARIMTPALERLAAEGLDVQGPWPADTIFLKAVEGALDAVVAPYHDVGMAVFKTLAFGRGVNTTLGLPFPRTSPDHGTAFDLAGTGRADAGSAEEALALALLLARGRAPRRDPPPEAVPPEAGPL